MNYGFWYDVAEYMNEAGRGKFTPREIAGNAYEYLCEWELTCRNCEPSFNMQALMEELEATDDENAKGFLEEIREELEYMRG